MTLFIFIKQKRPSVIWKLRKGVSKRRFWKPAKKLRGSESSWNPGDALLFYTDGALYALLGKTGGLDEIVLRLGPGLSADEIAQALRSEMEKIKEARGLEDDVTLLTVSL